MRFLALTATSCLIASAAAAADFELPKQLAWTAYGTGSAGYNQSIAIGAALQESTGVNLRILPGKNDISRNEPLRQGKVQFSANGIGGTYMSQEGVFEFGADTWGPQPVRVLLANNGGTVGIAVGVAAEACEKAGKPDCKGFEYADLKGMNVAWVKGAPALNVAVTAYLAYAGLGWDDVEKVEFGGYGASTKGLIDGSVDAVFMSTNSGKAYEAASSPRGLYWPPIDASNADGVKRMQDIAPYFSPMTASVGATIDDGPGKPTAGYAYPILMTMASQDADLAYNMTKAMAELYDAYKGKAPGINGWAIDKQNFEWVAPYHDGAIRYYTEIGVWTDAAQAHNDQLIARQAALAAAWAELKAEGPSDWEAAWDAKRREALKAGGFAVVF